MKLIIFYRPSPPQNGDPLTLIQRSQLKAFFLRRIMTYCTTSSSFSARLAPSSSPSSSEVPKLTCFTLVAQPNHVNSKTWLLQKQTLSTRPHHPHSTMKRTTTKTFWAQTQRSSSRCGRSRQGGWSAKEPGSVLWHAKQHNA
jgi:hypothetical protein